MELNDEDKERLQNELRSLGKAPAESRRWLRQRLDYAYAWSVGFISGILAAIKMND